MTQIQCECCGRTAFMRGFITVQRMSATRKQGDIVLEQQLCQECADAAVEFLEHAALVGHPPREGA